MNIQNHHLHGEITYGDLSSSLLEASLLQEEKGDEKPDLIVIWINSHGGNLFVATDIVNLIKSSKIPVVTVLSGVAHSAAFLILSAGHKRYAFENSFGMSHHFSTGLDGTYHQFKTFAEHNEQVHRVMENMLVENTKLNKAAVNKQLLAQHDAYFSSNELLKIGVVDEVIKADSNALGKINAPIKTRKKKKVSDS